MTNKKTLSALLLQLFCICAVAQDTKFSISGTVTDCKTHLPVNGMRIRLIGARFIMNTTTDQNGNYLLDSSVSEASVACILKCITETAPFGYTGSETKKIMLSAGLATNTRTESFCLVDMAAAETIQFPKILFREEKAELLSEREESNIKDMAAIMLNYPTFVFEIIGCNKVNAAYPDRLAIKQADFIKKKLLSFGIEPERLIVNKNTNSTVKIADDIETRYVTFTIIRKDYVAEQK